MTSPPASVARPVKDGDLRVTKNLGHGFGIADGNHQIALCMTEVDAMAFVALANASPPPPTTVPAPDAEAMRRVLERAMQFVDHLPICCVGKHNACTCGFDAMYAENTAALALPREDGGTKPMRLSIDDEIEESLDNLARPDEPPSTPTSELAKRLRDKARAFYAYRIEGTSPGGFMMEDAEILLNEAADALDDLAFLLSDRTCLLARVAELEAALAPLADAYDKLVDDHKGTTAYDGVPAETCAPYVLEAITLADLRRARAAIRAGTGG